MTNVVTHEEFNEMNKKFDTRFENLEKLILDFQKTGKWMSEDELAKLTGLSRSTLRRMRIAGEISSSLVRGKRLYNRDEIDKFIASKGRKN